MEMTPGRYSPTGPRCTLTLMDGIREGRCLDAHSIDIQPGGAARVFPCVKRWPQFFSFGDGGLAPKGSMHTNVPQHIVDRIRESRPNEPPQENFLCLGVLNRGTNDEDHLFDLIPPKEDEDGQEIEGQEIDGHLVKEYNDEEFDVDGFLKLDHFRGEEIVATRCSNIGAVIEWLFVPFIVEDENELPGVSGSTAAENEADADVSPQPTCANDSCSDSSPASPRSDSDDDVKASL
jgi:hypothetical protein